MLRAGCCLPKSLPIEALVKPLPKRPLVENLPIGAHCQNIPIGPQDVHALNLQQNHRTRGHPSAPAPPDPQLHNLQATAVHYSMSQSAVQPSSQQTSSSTSSITSNRRGIWAGGDRCTAPHPAPQSPQSGTVALKGLWGNGALEIAPQGYPSSVTGQKHK